MDFARLGQPTRDADSRAPDIWLAAKEGYQFNGALAGDQAISAGARRGAHGHLPDHDRMKGILIVWGAEVRPGTQLSECSNLEVAPTVAHLLGLQLTASRAQALRKILR